MSALYNEIDGFAAAWLRNLVAAGHIADGTVDQRSIKELAPDDCTATQCHFFAGIAGWSRALRLAGWPDDVPVWTGSCPCQPFSCAGTQRGFADERHLWPDWFRLIRQCRPPVIFGEQVASKVAASWLDAVFDDLEGVGYACWAAVLPACSVGAFHRRYRIYFVAHRLGAGWEVKRVEQARPQFETTERGGEAGNLADPTSGGQRIDGSAPGDTGHASQRKPARGVGDADESGLARPRQDQSGRDDGNPSCGAVIGGPSEGFWDDAIWLPCSDGKARPVESCSVEVADGLSDELGLVRFAGYPPHQDKEALIFSPLVAKGRNRVGRLRGYGNAIVPPLAATFIRIFMESMHATDT